MHYLLKSYDKMLGSIHEKRSRIRVMFLLSSLFNIIIFKFMAETTMHGSSVNSSWWTYKYSFKDINAGWTPLHRVNHTLTWVLGFFDNKI